MKTILKILKKIMLYLIGIIAVLAIAVLLYLQHPKFGKAPSGERLERIKKSLHYEDGKFQNIHFTPDITEGFSMMGLLYDQLFKTIENKSPNEKIPSVKTNLKELNPNENAIVWFGHSSYFMQLEGKKFLIDPVFSGNASPIPGSVKAFDGTDVYSVEDFPEIDFLIISHDHYDHLDYETIKSFIPKVKTVICGLGVGEHLEYWGYQPEIIIEKDWNETEKLSDSITLHTTPARHFSGRSFTRNTTLWLSYVIETPTQKIFLGGDSGYDTHFAAIGEKYGPFDLVILENGQYNVAWEAIHLLPEQLFKAAKDLKAKRLFPVHSSKFVLGMHAWNEPLQKASENSKTENIPILTPRIGEKIEIDNPNQVFTEWWKEVQ